MMIFENLKALWRRLCEPAPKETPEEMAVRTAEEEKLERMREEAASDHVDRGGPRP